MRIINLGSLNPVSYTHLDVYKRQAWSGDWQMAENNLKAAMGNAVPAGNLACLMSEFTEWVDRSQPPVFSFMVWKYYQLTHDLNLLARVFPTLLEMCIRDRFQDSTGTDFPERDLFDSDDQRGEYYSLSCRRRPVSYTHLDVYKRQGFYRPTMARTRGLQ